MVEKNRLTVIAHYANTTNFLYKELQSIFADDIKLNKYCLEEEDIKGTIDSDLFLIPDRSIFAEVQRYVKPGREILVINRTLTKKGFNKLLEVKPDTRVMLVNVNANMAIDTISLIYQLGIRHIELAPVYPALGTLPDTNLAITPNEVKHIPEIVEEVINIGDRVLDISTIMDIIVKFNLNNLITSQKVRDYFDKTVPISFGLEKMLGKTNRLESQLDMILKLLDVGIISISAMGVITSFNESASKILDKNKGDIIGRDADEIFTSIPFKKVLNTSRSIKEKLIKIDNQDIVLTVNPILKYGTGYGAIAIIRKFSDTEKKQHRLRAQLINKGHVAKYKFSDIVGNSEQIKKCRDIARRMATSNSTILLTGESGTGKELFAQAIHNYSARKDYQFVAVNCAALPESLLESELFGYAQGAFTGAKKEGKPGLFELAHKGTLLLDEIGEMPLKLQARLLRVLEEREVMRIGGDRVINIDLRIIAASNRDLYKLLKQKQFRQDLYYRLNILPLKIPPLRERREDILPLIAEFKRELKADFKLSPIVENIFMQHKWGGNIRELRNYIEYLTNLKKGLIQAEDLPFTISRERKYLNLNEEEKVILEGIKKEAGRQLQNYIFILSELKRRYNNNQRAGRRSISVSAKKNDIFLSEQEVRSILATLRDYELVIVKRGRGGTRITEQGKRLLEALKKG